MALFDSLLELTWRDIAVPCVSLDTEGGQDLAEHKSVNVDGARQEGTGLNPYQYPVRIPFINNIFPGPQESWDSENLFPKIFLEFLEALEDRSTGPLQHPIFGTRQCKAATWKISLNADERGGVFVDVVFRATNEKDETALGATSVLSFTETANDFTDQLGAIDPAPDFDLSDEGFDSLEDAANQLSAIGDQAELLQNKVVGKIDNVVAKVNKVADAIDKTAGVVYSTPGVIATHVAQLGPAAARIVESANRLNFALIGLKAELQVGGRPTGFYVTLTSLTLAGVAQELGNSVTDLVKLNPLLVQSPIVLPQTTVRYYTESSPIKVSSPFAA